MEENTGSVSVAAILLARYDPRFTRFINTHITRLLTQGSKSIQHAYRTKTRTIVEHEAKLVRAQETAQQNPTDYNKGLVRYYERELQRLRTEHEILRAAMDLAGIPIP